MATEAIQLPSESIYQMAGFRQPEQLTPPTPPQSPSSPAVSNDRVSLSATGQLASAVENSNTNQPIAAVERVLQLDMARLGENLQVALRGLGIGPNTNLQVMTGIDGSIVINGPVGNTQTLERQLNGSDIFRSESLSGDIRRLHMNGALIGAYNNNSAFREAFNANPSEAINRFSDTLQTEMAKPLAIQVLNGEAKFQNDPQALTQ